MKKLFISCPMRGRTEENIRKSMEKMHKIAEIVFDQKLEVIPTYIEHDPPETTDKRIWYLGQSILMMADADFYIGIRWTEDFVGCEIENKVASCYNLKSTFVSMDELMPDVRDIIRASYCAASC